MTAVDEMIEVRSLSLTYRIGAFKKREVRALRNVSLSVGPAEVVGLVGPNGSGKSSLFRSLLGFEAVDAQEIRVLGAAAGDPQSLACVGYVAEDKLPFPHLSGRELLTLAGTLKGRSPSEARERASEVLSRLGLETAADRQHKDYSTGMARRLAIAHAIYDRPRLLVLDEPTAGLDPLGIEIVRGLLAEHASSGGSAIVATHGLEDLADAMHRLVVLLSGEVVATGTPESVLADPGRRTLTVEGLDESGFAELVSDLERRGTKVVEAASGRKRLGAFLAELQRDREGAP